VRARRLANVVPLVVACLAGALGTLWFSGGRADSLQLRLPPSAGALEHLPAVDMKGFLVRGPGAPADLPGAWPQFRGPRRDAVGREAVGLARSWPAGGPATLWSVRLGAGYSGPAVRDGRVFVMDYDDKQRAELLRCLSLADGKEIWRRGWRIDIYPQHGISRTVPTVTDKHVVAFGALCHVVCADPATGSFAWGIELERTYNQTLSWLDYVPKWWAGQCPLIDGGRAILAVGGEKLMIAVDCATGRTVWRTPNPRAWRQTHSSILPIDFAGRRMYVYAASGGVAGVSAKDGSVLWEYPDWTVPTANVPTPVDCGDGRLFLTGGYRAGSLMLQLTERNGRIAAREVFRLKPDVFGSEQQTPVFHDGHLYGVASKDAGNLREQLICLDLAGRMRWASGRDERFGPFGGPYIIADGMIFVMDDHGVLTLVEAVPEAYRRLARAKVLSGRESWGPMALVGGRLLVRDINTLKCLDVRARP